MSNIHSGEEQDEEEKREEDSTGHDRHHSDVTDLGMMEDQVRSKRHACHSCMEGIETTGLLHCRRTRREVPKGPV